MNKKTKKIIAMASLLSTIMFTSCTNDDFSLKIIIMIGANLYLWSLRKMHYLFQIVE